MSTLHKNINQLRWKCRRSMLELDQILSNFVNFNYKNLTIKEWQTFDLLLQQEDVDLFSWIFGEALPDDLKLRYLIVLIKKLAVKT